MARVTSYAERMSFDRIAETCPEANVARGTFESDLQKALDAYHDAQKELRDNLRRALHEACQEISDMEDRIEELTAERDAWMKLADERGQELAAAQEAEGRD